MANNDIKYSKEAAIEFVKQFVKRGYFDDEKLDSLIWQIQSSSMKTFDESFLYRKILNYGFVLNDEDQKKLKDCIKKASKIFVSSRYSNADECFTSELTEKKFKIDDNGIVHHPDGTAIGFIKPEIIDNNLL